MRAHINPPIIESCHVARIVPIDPWFYGASDAPANGILNHFVKIDEDVVSSPRIHPR
jgi:hypothetical protein